MKNALILKKPSGTISIQLNINEQQQKMYNAILKKVEEFLEQDRKSVFYETQLSEILSLSGVTETNYDRIKDLLYELYGISVEYNVLGKDNNMEVEERAHLLDNLRFTKQGNQITIRYSIPDMVRQAMVKINDGKGIYAVIDLAVIKHLRSKYTIKLYELVRDYKNAQIPKMDINTFKKLFGIEKNYTLISNLKSRVLNPACKELNQNSEIDFLVSYNLIKEGLGQKYTHIKFIIKPKTKQKMLEEYKETSQLKILLNAVPKEDQTKSLEAYLSKCLKNYDAKYLLHQIEYITRQKPKNFFAYLKQAIKEDYANSEKAESEAELEKKRIQEAIERELENAQEEVEHDVSVRIDNERVKIYQEYMNLLTEDEKQALLEEYLQKAKEKYPALDEKSFSMEFKIQQLITEDIIAKNEIYQKRLSKVEEQAKEIAEKEFERIKKGILVKYKQIEPEW